MDALTLKDFKNVRDWVESENIQERIQAAKSEIVTKQMLKKLSNDKPVPKTRMCFPKLFFAISFKVLILGFSKMSFKFLKKLLA